MNRLFKLFIFSGLLIGALVLMTGTAHAATFNDIGSYAFTISGKYGYENVMFHAMGNGYYVIFGAKYTSLDAIVEVALLLDDNNVVTFTATLVRMGGRCDYELYAFKIDEDVVNSALDSSVHVVGWKPLSFGMPAYNITDAINAPQFYDILEVSAFTGSLVNGITYFSNPGVDGGAYEAYVIPFNIELCGAFSLKNTSPRLNGTSVANAHVFLVKASAGESVTVSGGIIYYALLPQPTLAVSAIDGLNNSQITEITIIHNSITKTVTGYPALFAIEVGERVLTILANNYISVVTTVNITQTAGTYPITVSMYPKTAVFAITSFERTQTVYKDAIATFSLTISNISNYKNASMKLVGFPFSATVYLDNSLLSKDEAGYFYLGDVNTAVLTIMYHATETGTFSPLAIVFVANDIIGTQTNTESINFAVIVTTLPIEVTTPGLWIIGENDIRIAEQNGQSFAGMVVIQNENGSEVYNNVVNLVPFGVTTLSVNITEAGVYSLTISWNNSAAVYIFSINKLVDVETTTKTVYFDEQAVFTVTVSNPNNSLETFEITVFGNWGASGSTTIVVAPSDSAEAFVYVPGPTDTAVTAYVATIEVYNNASEIYSTTLIVIAEKNSVSGGTAFENIDITKLVLIGLGIVLLGAIFTRNKKKHRRTA